MTQFTRIFLIGATSAMLLISASAHALVVKTDETDVNIWTRPGHVRHAYKAGKVQQSEEVYVLSEHHLRKGETWYKVRVRRFPGWRRHEVIGWVNAQYFRDIRTPKKTEETQVPRVPMTLDFFPMDPRSLPAAPEKPCVPNATFKGTDLTSLPEDVRHVLEFVDPAGKGTFITLDKVPLPVPAPKYIRPVPGEVRSEFGWRIHPVTGRRKFHKGTDFAGDGDPVHASRAGVVVESVSGCRPGRRRCGSGAGNHVDIKHADGSHTRYFHMSPACKLPPEGKKIAQDEVIGCVGATGLVTGPHLHFEVIEHGEFVNPFKVLLNAVRDLGEKVFGRRPDDNGTPANERR